MNQYRPLTLWLLALGVLAAGRPAEALPRFAREYGVSCGTCHSVAPRLNTFGLAFQANHFNWPGETPPVPGGTLKSALPSAIVTLRATEDHARDDRSSQFEELQLFFAGGFRAGGRRQGGYMAAVMATARDEKAGSLEEAFASLPVAGRRGQLALTVGQSSPLMHQWWHHTRLIGTPPAALSLEPAREEEEREDEEHEENEEAHVAHAEGDAHSEGAFSLGDHSPGLRLDYFSGRGTGTADGRYLTVGVPFSGELALNRSMRVGSTRGVYAHAFQRWGQDTLGAFAYTHGGTHLEGLIGTRALRPDLSVVAIGALGQDEAGRVRRLTLEGEYLASSRLGLTARLEALGGAEEDLGTVTALTYYPSARPSLRLTLQSNQRKGNRSLEIWARGQF